VVAAQKVLVFGATKGELEQRNNSSIQSLSEIITDFASGDPLSPDNLSGICPTMNDPIVSHALEEWDRRINDPRFAISRASFELKQRWRTEVSGTLKDIVRAENS
jgi:hypothetical protein